MSPKATRSLPVGTALITGATAGLGLEFAQQLARSGHPLVLVARNPERLDQVARQLGEKYSVAVTTMSADLTQRADVDRVAERISSSEEPIAILVNNAGHGLKQSFLTNDVETEQAHLDIHVTAPMRLTHAALRAMTTRGQGAIVNVASVAAFLPRGSYSAAKDYLVRFSEWANSEYADQGILVTALCPGFTRTEFHERMEVSRDSAPAILWLDPDRVVSEGLADLAAGKPVSVPSKRYKVIVTAATLIPSGALRRFQSLGRK
ncbi:MAG TPA: SDR family NAD(P)-dependent oxidoreductase [Marmoricola sp.]|nr:SDR family NAD(P)-dependent oxidoreductase [Marmoricola sp.]HNN47607.1 SDR family NAD(P)-dependent oxidoreductase [Marmoricola sp.]